MRGGNRSQDSTGHSKKKGPLTHRGKVRGRRRIGRYGIGDGGDMGRHNWSEPGKKSKTAQDTHALGQVWMRGGEMLITCGNLVKGDSGLVRTPKKKGGRGTHLLMCL